MGRIVGLLIIVALAVAGWLGYRLLERGGQFAQIAPVPLEGCEKIASPAGPEDLQIDHETGWIFVSAFDRRDLFSGGAPRGTISAIHIDRLGEGFVDLTDPERSGAPSAFAPHGISLYEGLGRKVLGVINHGGGTHTVELFEVVYDVGSDGQTAPTLQHTSTVTSEHFTSPNDIVMVGPDAFYVANDHWYADGWKNQAESYLMLDLAKVVYGQAGNVRIAAEGLSYGNGINVSADGRTLYVAETTDGTLRTYERDAETGELTLRGGKAGVLPIFRGPDNIDRAPDGSLWITGHPQILKVLGHAQDPAKHSPTQIVRVPLSADGAPGPAQAVFVDDGAQLSGGSVAAALGGKLVIGQIFDPFILVCPLPDGL